MSKCAFNAFQFQDYYPIIDYQFFQKLRMLGLEWYSTDIQNRSKELQHHNEMQNAKTSQYNNKVELQHIFTQKNTEREGTKVL